MVLPLIPVALIAIGAATGSGGAVLGGMGALDIKRATSRRNEARARYELCHKRTERRLAATNRRLQALRQQQEIALTDVVLRMADFLRRHERQVRESERLLVDGIDADAGQLQGLARLELDAAAWLAATVGSATAFAGTSMGLTTAASSFGVASTGAAISGLSGAAAESATLAFLGGGSLASGGGGMVLGAAALNVAAIGPGLLVGGLVTKSQGTKARTKAEEVEARVAVAIAELDTTDARLAAVKARVNELSSLLTELTDRAAVALDTLESEPFEPQAHAARFQRALMLVMAVRDVVATPVIDVDGELTEQSANLTIKYRAMTKEAVDA